ncbi:low affinity inorganic phosphate transporter 3-like [Cryptomeria japonica]|uniref:low affinity inorganic phosphate transporter 3-like n=1 Tax=Cryptomeria japonica TaxID=3369 RepID=UPI0027DA0EE7|nr:low affinity inorganic phosphate transporter 3-like [Cryptomeria japonica]
MPLRVLSALDSARTQLYHFSAIFIAGMGFFTDAYDLFCIPPVSNLLGSIYYENEMPIRVKASVNGIALCGALAGQLFFGWLGDRMGRKRAYGITLSLMVASSIASGFSIGRSAEAVIGSLCFFRFWLGFGIGGDYPLSATIMAEYANTTTRGAFIAAVFGMQGLGILASSIVALILSATMISVVGDMPSFGQKDVVWRIILMLGAVPAGFTYYWRMKMPETARYTALVANDPRQAAVDMSTVLNLNIEEDESDDSGTQSLLPQFGLFSMAFVKRHGLELLGTASTWFFVDIAFYSGNLFQSDIYHNIKWLKCYYKNPLDDVYRSARAQALIAFCGTLPGYIFTILLIDRLGRFKIQLIGFFFMSVFLFALAIPYESYWAQKAHRHGFLAIYSMTFFFSNFGPNTTTFIVPAELFPARLRSTCHGISAAAGKAGPIIGAFGFFSYPTGIGINNALIILAVASCLGFFCTFLIPETKGRSLEENEVELTQVQA